MFMVNLLLKLTGKKYNKLLNKDKIQLAFAPSSLILANYILPINEGVSCLRSFGERKTICIWNSRSRSS